MRFNDLKYYILFGFVLSVGIIGTIVITQNLLLQIIISSSSLFTSGAIFVKIIINLPSYQKFISPFLGTLSYIWKEAEYSSIAYNIQGNINQFRQTVNTETPDLIPEAKIEWVTKGDEESFFDEYSGQVIIRMRPSKENPKNLAKATLLQVSKGVIPESRIYVDLKMSTSIDLSLVKKILLDQNEINSYRYFLNEIMVPELEDEQILRYMETMEVIDEKGFFTRLFLRELKDLPIRHGLGFTNLSDIRNDTKAFLEYSELLSKRKRGELMPSLNYEGSYIKTAIVMIAITIRWKKEGLKPYVLRVINNIEIGCKVIYIIAWNETITYAKEVMKYLVENKIITIINNSDKPYSINNTRQICAALQVLERDTYEDIKSQFI